MPVVLLKTASKQLRQGSRKLQEGFAGARERLSLGDRKSTHTSSATSSFDESSPQATPSGSHHAREIGNYIQEGIHRIQNRLPSLGSASNHSSSSSRRRSQFLSGRMSSAESDQDSAEMSAEQHPGGDNHNDSNSSVEVCDIEESPVGTIRARVNRIPSALSSACSFSSMNGEELPMILSEEDEYNEAEDNENQSPKASRQIQKNPSDGENDPADGCEKEGVDSQRTGLKDANDTSPDKSEGSDVSVQEAVLPVHSESNKKSGKKRRKKTKEKDTKCVIH